MQGHFTLSDLLDGSMEHRKPCLTSAPVVFNDWPSNGKLRLHVMSSLDHVSLFAAGGRCLIGTVLESVLDQLSVLPAVWL